MKRVRGRTRSEASKEKSRERALEQGKGRHDAVVLAVQGAMRAIKDDITYNNGVYPSNGGIVSLSELIRRAGVGEKTLFGPKYKETFKRDDVEPWLLDINTPSAAPLQTKRKSAVQQAAEWRESYTGLLTSYRKSELDLQEARRELEGKGEQIVELERENQGLRDALAKTTARSAIPIPGRGVRRE